MSIDIILNSKFNATGVDQAIASMKGLEDVVQALGSQGGIDNLFRNMGLDEARERLPGLITSVRETGEALNDLSARAFAFGDASKGMELQSLKVRMDALAEAMTRAAGETETIADLQSRYSGSLVDVIPILEQKIAAHQREAQALRDSAAIAQAANAEGEANKILQASKAYDQKARTLEILIKAHREYSEQLVTVSDLEEMYSTNVAESIPLIQARIWALQNEATILRERATSAFAEGEDEHAQKLIESSKAVEQKVKALQSVIPAEEEAIELQKRFTQSIEESIPVIQREIRELEKREKGFRDSAAAAAAKGDTSAEGKLSAAAAADRARISALQSLLPLQEKIKQETISASEALKRYGIDTKQASQLVREQANALQEQAQAYRAAAANARQMGDTEAEQALLKEAGAAQQAAGAYAQFGKTAGNLSTKIMSLLGPFNMLGFAAFITMSTIRTFTQALESMLDVAAEGAGVIDRLAAFNTVLPTMGVSANELREKLEAASKGAVSFDDAMKNTLRLAKAGFPEIASQSDKLLSIATSAAIVSGELDNVGTIYDKLVRGIIRGSPRLIDDADIILKLGDANEKYARSLGKTVEQLTAAEKVQATFNAVIEEGGRIEDLAEEIDSVGLKVARFKNELADAGRVAKSIWATIVESGLDALTATGMVMQGVVGEIAKMLGATDKQAQTAVKHFTTLDGFLQAVAVGAHRVGAVIVELARAVNQYFINLGRPVQITVLEFEKLWASIFGNTQRVQELDKRISDLRESMSADPVNLWRQAMDNASQSTEEFAIAIGAINPKEVVEPFDEAADAAARLNQRLKLLSDQIKAGLDPLSDANIAREGAEKRADIEEDHADKLIDIREDLRDKLLEISRDLADKLQDLLEDRNDRLEQAERDYVDKIADINEDLADKLADASSDADKRREKLAKEKAKKLEDIEEDHQAEINKILRRYEMDRLNALIDRDARALFEAQLKRDEDLANAQESRNRDRKEAEEDFQEEMQEIAEQEQERRDEAIEAANERREDARRAYEEQRRDAQEQYEKARREAKEAAEEQRQDAKKAYNDARRDAQDSYRERLRDLQEWYQDQFRAQQEARIRERLQELQAMAEREELLSEHLDNLSRMWADYNQFVANLHQQRIDIDIPTYSGGISSVPNVSPSAPNIPSAVIPGSGPQSPVVPFGGGGFYAAPPTTQQQPERVSVNIRTNDPTLNEILMNISYEAFAEIMR